MKEWGEAGIFSQMTLFVEETCRLFQYGMEWEDCLCRRDGSPWKKRARAIHGSVAGIPSGTMCFLKSGTVYNRLKKSGIMDGHIRHGLWIRRCREASGQPVIPFSKTDVFLSRPWI